jgi:dipeptide/tripeptide permease
VQKEFQVRHFSDPSTVFHPEFSAVLLLYFNRKLGFDPSISTAFYHAYELLDYFATIFGAVVADSYLGLYKTITLMSLLFSIGSVVVSLTAIELLNLPRL